MTTIAYRDGVLAADSRAYSGHREPMGTKVKIREAKDGSIWGCSSSEVGADTMLARWVDGGCQAPKGTDIKPSGFWLLVVRPDGGVFYAKDNLALTGPLEAEYFAIGSGADYAMGAMACGATAADAVAVAAKLDVYTGGPITVLSVR